MNPQFRTLFCDFISRVPRSSPPGKTTTTATMRNYPPLLYLVVLCIVILQSVSPSSQLESNKGANGGRALRNQMGTLYDLRHKLSRPASSSGHHGAPRSSSFADGEYRSEKEGRGYSFHYNPSDISHPLYSTGYTSQDFHSRMGKIADASPSIKKKTADKNWDKYSKLAYKTIVDGKEQPLVNSFNIHTNETYETKTAAAPSTTTPTSTTTTKATSPAPFTSVKTSSTSAAAASASSGFDLSRLATIGLGINDAMTSVLTQKLMNMIDQEVPQGILNPLKHLVSSGNRMVEFWDKRANARDGKPPGIVEMMGYGLETLKKYRDGQSMKASDPITNITSASKTLIQGMITVKKLTNRVLGYDTEEAAVESRGGYGHDSYGGGGYGHHVSYGGGIGGLDPFALLAALAFGAFLLQLLLTLLNTSARSLDVVDINTPLLLSDFHVPGIMTNMDKIFGTPTTRTKRSALDDENPVFNSVIDKLDGIYKTYKVVSNKPSCARLFLCRVAIQDVGGDESSLSSKLYTYGLQHLLGTESGTEFVRKVKGKVSKGEDVDCSKEVPDCDISDEQDN